MKPILIVEDDTMQQKMLSHLLKKRLNFDSYCVDNGREALRTIKADVNREIKLIIMDIEMPVLDGIETLKILRANHPEIPVIMASGSDKIHDVVTSMKFGAIDFITKPYDVDSMMITAKNAVRVGLLSENDNRGSAHAQKVFLFENLIGHNNGLETIITTGRKIAPSDIPAFITGETGVGKEVFARALHGESNRADKPFVAVNCGAIPHQLVESTLFGHEKGAFTGATEKAIGKFRHADGGTIFLDEIGELPLDAQTKLLRVLQESEVEPVGSAQSVPINVRIISATNRDLAEEVRQKRFREDLYFRLNVVSINLPTLRQRRSDIILLAEHFIETYNELEGSAISGLTAEAKSLLKYHDWPGNIRELENTLRRAIVLCDTHKLDAKDFPSLLHNKGGVETSSSPSEAIQPGSYSIFNTEGKIKPLEIIEHEIMRITLETFNQNITKASKALGMSKSTFYRKMSQWG